MGKELSCEEYGPCGNRPPPSREGSIIIAVATDAPLVVVSKNSIGIQVVVSAAVAALVQARGKRRSWTLGMVP